MARFAEDGFIAQVDMSKWMTLLLLNSLFMRRLEQNGYVLILLSMYSPIEINVSCVHIVRTPKVWNLAVRSK